MDNLLLHFSLSMKSVCLFVSCIYLTLSNHYPDNDIPLAKAIAYCLRKCYSTKALTSKLPHHYSGQQCWEIFFPSAWKKQTKKKNTHNNTNLYAQQKLITVNNQREYWNVYLLVDEITKLKIKQNTMDDFLLESCRVCIILLCNLLLVLLCNIFFYTRIFFITYVLILI